MTEKEYLNARDLGRVITARNELREILCFEDSICDRDNMRHIISVLSEWENKLFKVCNESVE